MNHQLLVAPQKQMAVPWSRLTGKVFSYPPGDCGCLLWRWGEWHGCYAYGTVAGLLRYSSASFARDQDSCKSFLSTIRVQDEMVCWSLCLEFRPCYSHRGQKAQLQSPRLSYCPERASCGYRSTTCSFAYHRSSLTTQRRTGAYWQALISEWLHFLCWFLALICHLHWLSSGQARLLVCEQVSCATTADRKYPHLSFTFARLQWPDARLLGPLAGFVT